MRICRMFLVNVALAAAVCSGGSLLIACSSEQQTVVDVASPASDAAVDMASHDLNADVCNPDEAPACVTSCEAYLFIEDEATCDDGRWSCGEQGVAENTCPAPNHAPSVDPFIGTGGLLWTQAMLFPGATLPFGMVRLSPDLCYLGGIIPADNAATAGYHDSFTHTWGFSHTRLSGTGSATGGLFRVTPATAKPNPAIRSLTPLSFSHNQETASPGYYSVLLPGVKVMVELTATTHVGVHRYSFPAGAGAFVVLDVSSHLQGQSTEGGWVNIDPVKCEVSGSILLKGGFARDGLRGYFVARFDQAFEGFGSWAGGPANDNAAEATGDDVGAYVRFKAGGTVEVRLGLSYVSADNARENLDAQAAGRTFAELRAAAEERWNEQLRRIHINTSDPDVKKIFYTSLYHALIMPTNITDENGAYLGFEAQVGTATDFSYYTDLSMWDTVRTVHPLLILAYPGVQRDCLKSLVRMGRIGGALPRWPAGGGYTGSMFGTPADMMVAESYLKGITDFEVDEAFEMMKKTALADPTGNAPGRDGNLLCLQHGYCPADLMSESVPRTLEYAWADDAIAGLAQALGKTDDAATFAQRAKSYENTWNPQSKYFQPRRADGSFVEPLLTKMTTYDADAIGDAHAKELMDDYVEGSPQQWRWSVQQDPQGLIALFGGAGPFVSQLETFMKNATQDLGALHPGPAYWHGNEHDFHAPYLFNDAGRPDLTQKWVRWALTTRYGTGHGSLDGNDDGGTLSAWYVLSALGFYPIVGSASYWIGAPIVDSAQIVVDGEVIVTIIAENQSADNLYVQELFIDDDRHCAPIITHDQLRGSTLRYRMGPTPAVQGGFDCPAGP